MDELSKRLEELSPEKRELLEMFLHEQDTASAWRREDYVAPRTPAEQTLAAVWEQVLGVERVGVNDDFFELGGDSIQSLQVIAHARRAGLHLTSNQLFAHSTIAKLAPLTEKLSGVSAEQGTVVGPVPLTPVQRWFFEQDLPEPHHWNQAVLLEVRLGADPSLFEEVFRQLLDRHDALRLRFENVEGVWRQGNAAAEEGTVFSSFDFSALPEQEQASAVEETANGLQVGLNLSRGPLVRAAYFHLGVGRPGRLLLVSHHLVADAVSFRVLVEDAQTAYEQLARGELVNLPPKTTSFRHWSELVSEHARSPEAAAELSYWLAAPEAEATRLPRDIDGGVNTEASSSTITVRLNEEETRALTHELPAVYRAQANELLLTALAEAVTEWAGARSLLLDVEGHGREEIIRGVDLSRTVGWFTSIFPLRLDLGGAQTPADSLVSVKEQLRSVPRRGIGYGLLRYLCEDSAVVEKLKGGPRTELVFNYLGQFDQVLSAASLFQPAQESYGALYGGRNVRPYLLQVFGGVTGGRLEMNWAYSRNVHRRDTIERVAGRFAEKLRALIAGASGGAHYAPSDFPEAELSQGEIDALFQNRGGAERRCRVVRREDVEDIYTLSPMQQGMLFEVLSRPDSGVYFEQGVCTLGGELDAASFEQAWRLVVARHPALRTAFAWEGLSKPVQVVHRQAELSVEQMDWRAAPAGERQGLLRDFLRANRERSFDLATPPLMRLTLVRLGEDSYQFVWAIHHLIHDAWSTFLLLKEVLALYAGLRGGRAVPLSPAAPYKAYISYLKQKETGAEEEFWRRYLSDFRVTTALPETRAQRQETGDETHAQQETRLSSSATAALEAPARRQRLTLNTLAVAAWAWLLSRYSGRDDVVFGTVMSGRPEDLEGADRMVGLFINTLPTRVRVPTGKPLLEWLRELQEMQTELRGHELTPLRQVQNWSELPRGARLFESILVFQNAFTDISGREVGGLKVDHIRSVGHSNVPLTMRVTPGRELLLEVLYDTRRFDAATVGSVLRQMAATFEVISSAPPDATVGTLISMPGVPNVEQAAGEQNGRRRTLARGLAGARPRTLRLSADALVQTELLPGGEALPLVVRPSGPELNLADWVAGNRETVEERLLSHGGILFRGFTVDSVEGFARLVKAVSPHLLEYRERSTPRTDLGGNIYTSTEYPAHQTIAFHNEFSYAYTWPMKICFHCEVAPTQGGETPIADSRRVFRSLDPKLRDRFIEKGVMYVRNYGGGIDLSWQEVFRTSSREEVEEHCRNSPMLWEWKGADRLRTKQVRPAVARHPKTGEMVWFNQAHLFHLSNLEPAVRRSMREAFGEEDLPRQAYYGDGSPIEDSVLDEVREAYRLASTSFPWQKGDVLLLDNMLTAHGRSPFAGERRILAAMAEPFTLQIESRVVTAPVGA